MARSRVVVATNSDFGLRNSFDIRPSVFVVRGGIGSSLYRVPSGEGGGCVAGDGVNGDELWPAWSGPQSRALVRNSSPSFSRSMSVSLLPSARICSASNVPRDFSSRLPAWRFGAPRLTFFTWFVSHQSGGKSIRGR